MKRVIRAAPVLLLFAFLVPQLISENFILRGSQESVIQYSLSQELVPAGDTPYLKMSFVAPESFTSVTSRQTIENFSLSYDPKPASTEEHRDKRGNRVIEMIWHNPATAVSAKVSCIVHNSTVLTSLASTAPFPVQGLPADVRVYLDPSKLVQSDDAAIRETALSLTKDVKTMFDAVQHIISWIVDHMRYVSPPQQYDALYSYHSGKGNCQNYSHLAAALMRAVGIPVRIANGVTLDQPYTVSSNQGEFTFKMGKGRHSWIEIFFPDLGWVPYDPQQTELFISNRFIRIEVGVDNAETENDGVIRYRQSAGVSGRPQFRESIEAVFSKDEVALVSEKQDYGPAAMLLSPEMKAAFIPVKVEPPPPPKPEVEEPLPLDQMVFDKAWLFGNLLFPRKVDFLSPREASADRDNQEVVLQKNFMVETAEYVSTKITQYAQVFVSEKPLKPIKIGLALHKFGGNGQLWIDLLEDKDGRPGNVIAASKIKDLSSLPRQSGYDWVDFDFSSHPPLLAPGRYWIALGFTGSPIINWFYTYGKPVGPVDGTRYKSVFDEEWSGALAYEFNYRVAGWTTRR